jgi:fructoselysine 6-kinase
MKIISVGDNVVDCYIDQQKYYPGGNAVNVAVNSKRYGAVESAYIGIFGDDEPAEHIKKSLKAEGVDYSFSRKVYAPSSRPQVMHNKDGERIFIEGPKDTVQHILRLNLTEKDIKHISKFDICHTSFYSSIEPELEKISKACGVSFDFSDEFTLDYVESISRSVKYAFFSGSGRSDKEINELIQITNNAGIEVVGITLGSNGALFINRGKQYIQSIKPVKVVDTMGAGDSFISGFLTSYIDNDNMSQALDFAADCAAKCCSYYGGFGYPHPYGDKI